MRNSYVSLGWFSIGLGAAEIVFPRAICRWLGVKPHPVLLRVLGLREITSGMGLLSGQDTAGWPLVSRSRRCDGFGLAGRGLTIVAGQRMASGRNRGGGGCGHCG